jgi:ribosome assembly protein YihI (activator of Der GTPase)
VFRDKDTRVGSKSLIPMVIEALLFLERSGSTPKPGSYGIDEDGDSQM